MVHAYAHGRACPREGDAVVDGCYVRYSVTDVDYDAGNRAGCIELRHGTVKDAEGCDVKTLEEYLACAFVGFAWETGYEGEEDRRLVLYAAELEAGEEDVFPVWVGTIIPKWHMVVVINDAMVNKKVKKNFKCREKGRVAGEGDKRTREPRLA